MLTFLNALHTYHNNIENHLTRTHNTMQLLSPAIIFFAHSSLSEDYNLISHSKTRSIDIYAQVKILNMRVLSSQVYVYRENKWCSNMLVGMWSTYPKGC